MKVARVKDTKPIESHGIIVQELIKGSKTGIALCRMRPKAAHTPHMHFRTEEKYYFLSGEGKMKVGDEEFEVSEGTAVNIPTATLHTLHNTSKEDLVFIAVSCPPYDPEDEKSG
jgi:mannose-6-phosphate isomerase-like protein (cupin superfamily)